MPCDDTVPHPVNCGTAGSFGIGILTGYNSNAGYDLVTGLGSVNAANLVKNWSAFAVNLKSSATTLSISPTTNIVHGAPVTVNIGVSPVAPATGTPTGTVSLLSTSSLDPGVTSFTLSAGSFSGTTGLLPGGTYTVTANYPGDSTFSGSASSPAIPITVTPEGSKTSVTVLTQNAQGVVSTFTSGPYGSAPLYPRVDVVGNSGNGYPSGSVTLLDNGQPINGGLTLPLNSQGNALPTNPIFTFSPGSHSLTASYTGDASFDASSNPSSSTTPATFTITQAPVSFMEMVSGPETIFLGSSTTISASISGTSCGNPPTGTISFFNGSTQLGAAQTVQATAFANCNIQAQLVSVNSASFAQGENSVTARYSGDSNYTSAVSAPLMIDAVAPTTTTLTANPTNIVFGQSITITAKVAPNTPGGPPLTGYVEFGSASLGPLGTPTISNGQAQITTTNLPGGTNALYANYSGDTNYNGSSGGLSVTVTVPDFSISGPSSPVTVTAGQTGTATVTITPSSNATSTVMLSCGSITVFKGATCSVSQPSVTLAGGTPATVTLSIATLPPSSTTTAFGLPMRSPRALPPSGMHVNPAVFISFAILGYLFFAAFPGKQRFARVFAGLVVVALLSLMVNCGGGSGGGGPVQTATSISASSTKIAQGSMLTLTANVTPTKSATGTVTFQSNCGYGSTVNLTNGSAQIQVSSSQVGVGTCGFSSFYIGDANDIASQSGTLNIAFDGSNAQIVQAQTSSVNHAVQVSFTLQ
jgi:hypothetical protein